MRKSRKTTGQMALPGALILGSTGQTIAVRNRRIPHKKILEAFEGSTAAGSGIVELYRREVVPIKTRTIQLLGRKGPAAIHHTLLGYEVQASYKRIHCPDLVTARYLKLFSELGCRTIRLPYDPTITARLIPLFESATEALAREVREMFPWDRKLQAYVLRYIYHLIRLRLRQENRATNFATPVRAE
jgi:hypothetical protein